MDILTNEYLQSKAPSIFTETSFNRTAKYTQIPTFKILEALKSEGFNAVKVQQQRKLDASRVQFVKHVIRLRHVRDCNLNNEYVPEVVLLNSHDGASSYKMMLGIFRLVCSNGLIVASSSIASINVRHTGQASQLNQLIEGAHSLISNSSLALSQISQWQSTILTLEQKKAYLKGAFDVYREGREDVQAYETDQLGYSYRRQDMKDDLWTLFNKTQENFTKGNFYLRGNSNTFRRARRITSIDKDTRLNQALWQYTQEFKLN